MEPQTAQTGDVVPLAGYPSRHIRPLHRKSWQLVAALLATVAMLPAGCNKIGMPAAGPPDVQVTEVVQKDVPITQSWVATLNGLVNAQIRAQVTGILLRQDYTNGAYVSKGTLLFEIDPRPFKAALDQATGNLSQAKATLQQAEARQGKTQMDVTRYTPLAQQHAISQQELDDAVQANLAALASVQEARSSIESMQAAVENAKLNLGFASIVSPIDGVAAIATAQVGDYVGPQSGTLTTISTVNPILVNFTPSEQEYLAAMRDFIKQGIGEDAALRKLVWQLTLADGTVYSEPGRFYALDRQVDIRTGAILMQIQFPNPQRVLRPGGFGSVSTTVEVRKDALLIPQRAVSELQGGYQVAVIGADNKVTLHAVTMGPKFGSMWVVADGLKTGERVVAEGVRSVQSGELVNPKPYK
jgi:membrane fusion protein, multidrug efflux system